MHEAVGNKEAVKGVFVKTMRNELHSRIGIIEGSEILSA